jgi:hypothetical protein
MNYKRNFYGTLALILCTLLVITACGGQQTKSESQEVAKQQPDPPLSKRYQNIVILDMTTTPEIEKNYPDAHGECRDNLVRTLESKGSFANVVRHKAGTQCPNGSLLVETKITDMRIVSGAARFWGGALAGSSYINVEIKLMDDGKTVLREKKISSNNNSFAAAWAGGASDRSLPADMGKMIAGYLDSINPQK